MKILIDGTEKTINQAIKEEMQSSNGKYGDKNTQDEWLNILAEDFGKVANETNKLRTHPHSGDVIKDKIKINLVKVIATSLRFLKNI